MRNRPGLDRRRRDVTLGGKRAKKRLGHAEVGKGGSHDVLILSKPGRPAFQMRPPYGILDPSLARGRDGSGYWRWSRECRNPSGLSAGFASLARGCFARSREIVAGVKWP